MLEELMSAVAIVFQPNNLALLIIGFLIGHLFGLIPGLSSLVALPILIPYSYNMDFYSAIIFLISIMGGSTFAGSISCILWGIPGQGMNLMTLIDGHPLAKQGKGAMAVGAAATASAMGSVFSLLLLLLLIPFISKIILSFGPPESLAFVIFGFLAVALSSRGQVIESFISAAVGLLVSFVGYNMIVGGTRFVFGIDYLWSGISMVPMFIGMYGIAEFINITSRKKQQKATPFSIATKELIAGALSVFRNWFLWLRCSVIGLVIGAIPGLGGIAATIVAYTHAAQTSKNPEMFGKGDIRGVIAPESANNAKDGGQLMPTLALGIPGGPEMALLLGAFLLHGIRPGTNLFEANLYAVLIIVVAYVVSNIFTSVFGMGLGSQMAKLVALPPSTYMTIVLVMGLTGAYVSNYNILDVLITAVFGLLGYAFILFKYPVGPFTVAFILGPLLEKFYFQSLQMSRGDYSVFILHSPVVIAIWVFSLVSVAYYLWSTKKDSSKSRMENAS